MAQKKERLYYLDYARGIGIVLMVFGHIMDENHLPVSWFYGIHIAIFFVLSGILMAYTQVDKRPLKKVIAGYARSLLLPCITYEVIFVAMYGILYHFDYSPLGHQPWDILKLRPVNTPMWFLITSFFAQLALVLLLKGYDALTKKKSDSEKAACVCRFFLCAQSFMYCLSCFRQSIRIPAYCGGPALRSVSWLTGISAADCICAPGCLCRLPWPCLPQVSFFLIRTAL